MGTVIWIVVTVVVLVVGTLLLLQPTSTNTLSVKLPAWVQDKIQLGTVYATDQAKMKLVIQCSAWNVEMKTGGPFGAAVFDAGHRLVSVGVNRVASEACSAAHAEVVALSLAQQHHVRSYTLRATRNHYTLATSSQMCIMCLGAVCWSGVSRVIYGATGQDVESLTGFDEGPVPLNWKDECLARNILVTGPLLQEEARAVLVAYKKQEGVIYNGLTNKQM